MFYFSKLVLIHPSTNKGLYDLLPIIREVIRNFNMTFLAWIYHLSNQFLKYFRYCFYILKILPVL